MFQYYFNLHFLDYSRVETYFSYIYWPFIDILLCLVCLYSLPIFQLGYLFAALKEFLHGNVINSLICGENILLSCLAFNSLNYIS